MLQSSHRQAVLIVVLAIVLGLTLAQSHVISRASANPPNMGIQEPPTMQSLVESILKSLPPDLKKMNIAALEPYLNPGKRYPREITDLVQSAIEEKLDAVATPALIDMFGGMNGEVKYLIARVLCYRDDCTIDHLINLMNSGCPDGTKRELGGGVAQRLEQVPTSEMIEYVNQIISPVGLLEFLAGRDDYPPEELVSRLDVLESHEIPTRFLSDKLFRRRLINAQTGMLVGLAKTTNKHWILKIIGNILVERRDVSTEDLFALAHKTKGNSESLIHDTEFLQKLADRRNFSVEERVQIVRWVKNMPDPTQEQPAEAESP